MRLRLPIRGRKGFALLVVAVVVVAGLLMGAGVRLGSNDIETIGLEAVMGMSSDHRTGYDHVLVGTGFPILAAAATPLACWYDKASGTASLVPLLVDGEPEEATQQLRLKDSMGLSRPLAVIGYDHTTTSTTAALAAYERAAGAIVVETNFGGYSAAIVAGAIASYLDVPVLVYEGEATATSLRDCLDGLDARYVLLAGPFADGWRDVARRLGRPVVRLDGPDLHAAQLALIADRFGRVDYGVLTNPSDVAGIDCFESQTDGPVEWDEQGRFTSVQRVGHVETFSATSSTATVGVPGEAGVQRLQVRARLSNMQDPLEAIKQGLGVVPILSLWLEDGSGGLVAYGSSIGYRAGEAALDVVTMDIDGELTMRVSAFYGIKGRSNLGTMGQNLDGVGWTRISADWQVQFTRTPLASPLVPQLPGLSRLAPYLAAAHGGFVMADPDLSYLDGDWASTAGAGTSTGPWYDEGQQDAVNARVKRNVDALQHSLGVLSMVPAGPSADGDMLMDTYTSGPAWLAILGDAASIPQWYEPKDPSWVEDVQYGLGWASDEPYRLNGSLSIGRPLSTTVAGVSTLLARTIFYEQVAQAHEASLSYPEDNGWSNNYLLLYGEGGGQTGGLFWQQPFADELRGLDFDPHQYGGNFQNDRQTMEARGAYERSNYMEIMLHGNWYWYCPEINGIDEYSTSVKVLDVRNWELGPSVFLTAACLMGRIDGVPAQQVIGLALIHAGVNAFLGATRSTGSESGTRWTEWDLIYNDTSVGEAHRHAMAVHPEPPTVWVRTLFADPAFNPYEPENGFSDQGRPVLLP